MQKIRVTIRRDGTQKIEVLGGRGSECVSLTQALEKRLGEPDGERKLKSEYSEDPLHLPEIERQREGG